MAHQRKQIFFIALTTLVTIFALSSCKQDKAKAIIGKWQHIYIVRLAPKGNDTIDMQGSNTFNSFHEDGTLYITNGDKEVNTRYIVAADSLKTFLLQQKDTVSMSIKQLDKHFLALRFHWKEAQRPDEVLIYKRVD